MNWRGYELEEAVLKANEAIMLWKTENGIVEIGKNTLAVPLKKQGKISGFVFHGNCKFMLDTIVETKKGAVGKSVEKEITEPFLVLKDAEELRQKLGAVNKEELESMNYESEKEFIAKAKALCDRFFGENEMQRRVGLHGEWEGKGVMFAFPRNESFDLLIAKDSKLVYRAADKVFLSNNGKVILKTTEDTVIARNGNSLLVKTRICC
ncbi:MAG: hypothetical protein QW840_00945 [Candidatus Bathyarchaeia archaeon]